MWIVKKAIIVGGRWKKNAESFGNPPTAAPIIGNDIVKLKIF